MQNLDCQVACVFWRLTRPLKQRQIHPPMADGVQAGFRSLSCMHTLYVVSSMVSDKAAEAAADLTT